MMRAAVLMLIAGTWMLLAGPGQTVVMIVLVLLGLALLLSARRILGAFFRFTHLDRRFTRLRGAWQRFLRPPAAQRVAPSDRAVSRTPRAAAHGAPASQEGTS